LAGLAGQSKGHTFRSVMCGICGRGTFFGMCAKEANKFGNQQVTTWDSREMTCRLETLDSEFLNRATNADVSALELHIGLAMTRRLQDTT
jgi:hypothetical protein